MTDILIVFINILATKGYSTKASLASGNFVTENVNTAF